MRHRVHGKKLNRNIKQRKALFKSLANSVVLYEKVETTEAKAKAVKPYIEKLVTISKEDSLNARRQLVAKLSLKNSVAKLLEVIGPTFKDRPGGYLRITKLPPRAGDSAKMVVIEFVEEVSTPKKKIKKQTKKPQNIKSNTKKNEKKSKTAVKAENKPAKIVKDEKPRKDKERKSK